MCSSPGAVRTTMNRRHLVFNDFLTFRGFNPQLASIKALTRFLKMQFFSSFLCNIREEAIWFPFSTHRPRSATCKLWGGAAPQSVRARPRICRIFPLGVGPLWAPPAPKYNFPNPAHLQVLPKSRFGRKCIMVKLAVCAFSKKVTTH